MNGEIDHVASDRLSKIRGWESAGERNHVDVLASLEIWTVVDDQTRSPRPPYGHLISLIRFLDLANLDLASLKANHALSGASHDDLVGHGECPNVGRCDCCQAAHDEVPEEMGF
jgi:hypothetical protein